MAIVSGGNVDNGLLASVLRRRETAEGRRVRLFTRVPDRPGGLAELLNLVADARANLLSLEHVREAVSLSVRETGVELTLETRGAEHTEQVRARCATPATRSTSSTPDGAWRARHRAARGDRGAPSALAGGDRNRLGGVNTSPRAIHHLACGTMCPHGGRCPAQAAARRRRIVCHCLLVEGAEGLVLIDTGFGLDDMRNTRQLGAIFKTLFRPQAREADTAIEQVRALGFAPEDVRHIVATHLDVDHAGGLPDFPAARGARVRAGAEGGA